MFCLLFGRRSSVAARVMTGSISRVGEGGVTERAPTRASKRMQSSAYGASNCDDRAMSAVAAGPIWLAYSLAIQSMNTRTLRLSWRLRG